MNSDRKILVTGASGQLGIELTARLRQLHNTDNVIATDIRDNPSSASSGPFERLDVLDREQLAGMVKKHKIDEIYHLAAILSAKGEKQISLAWNLNINGLLNMLETALNSNVRRIFWPSSIAVFGPDAPRKETPQNTPLNPTTVYGISKVAGEHWSAYYHRRFGVDVRSIRYPGLIGYKSEPGGGTTDYAVDMFRAAAKGKPFECPIDRNTCLPMMYMDDAVKAAVDLMAAPPERIRIRTSYNITAMSFSPEELATSIRKHNNNWKIDFAPDDRDNIAASWPDSIDDSEAQKDWQWKPAYDLDKMTDAIFQFISGVEVPDN